METVKFSINLATQFVADRVSSLKGKSLDALCSQLVRSTEGHLEDFLRYLDAPDKFATEDFAINGNALLPLSKIYSNRTEEYLRENDLILQVNNEEYILCKIIDVDFLRFNSIEFLVEFPCAANKKETKFVSINELSCADLL